MRAASLLSWISLLLSLPNLAASQSATPAPTHPSIIEQPIIHPNKEDQLTPGESFTIQWTPNPAFSNITLELWDKTSWGYSRDFGDLCYHWVNPFCGTIVSHAPNTGSFEWHIPKPGSDFPRGQRVFWIKMYVDDYWKPDIGNMDPVLSYSQNFAFALLPGQTPTVSSSEIVQETSSSGEIPATVTITVWEDPTSQVVVAPTSLADASVTASGGPQQSSVAPAPSQGIGSRLQNAFPAGLLLLWALL